MSSKSLTFLICLLMLPTALIAQSAVSISGTVKDPAGAVVPRATVMLVARDNSYRTQAISNGTGAYRFDNVEQGTYLLSASAAGFVLSSAKVVDAKKSLQVDLELRISAVATSVSVTASGTAQTADELAKSVSVVDSQTMMLLNSSTVADSLSYVPGLRIVQEGGPGGLISIKTRGLRDQDTAVLMDGFRLREPTAIAGDASSLLQDLLVVNTDRIEVLRGTGSSIYGTDATGGVVNIITGATGGAPHSAILLEGGSMSTFRGKASISGGVLSDKLGYSLGIAHDNTSSGLDGYLPARTSGLQGRLDYALSRETHISGRLFITDSFNRMTQSPQTVGAVPATGIIDAVPLSSSQLRLYETGTPISALNVGSANFISDYDDPDQTRTARDYSGAALFSSRPVDSLGLSASYQGLATHRKYDNGPLGAGYYQPVGGNSTQGYDGTIHTVNARVDWRLGKYQSINAGYEFENEHYNFVDIEPPSSGNSSEDVTQRSHALFVQDQIHLLNDRLQLAGSYRTQFFSLSTPILLPEGGTPYSGMTFAAPPTANTWDASAAYRFQDAGTKLRAHVGTGYRAPSLYQRFGAYYYYGFGAMGDPELKPETSTGVDGGVDQVFWNGKAQASATYFYTRLHEVIDYSYSLPADDPYGRYSGYYNTHGGIARGVESSFTVMPVRTLRVQAGYTFTNARENTPKVAGIYKTFDTPDHMFSVLVTENITPRFTVIFGATAQSSYLAQISSYAFRFDGMKKGQIGATYRMPLSETRAIRFFANVNNAFHQSYYEGGYRTPGTTAMSGLQFEF